MIVSSRMVVFPVCRSPMISSRWHDRSGIMASMAMMPVCTGSLTRWRVMTPGAIFLDRAGLGGLDRALAVDRLAEGVHGAAQQLGAHRDLDDAAGARTSSPS